MNQQPMQNPKPAMATWLWVVLGVVVVAGAAFFNWYYLMGPGKKTTTTTTPTTTTTTDKTAGWQTYSNTADGFSIKYPKKLTGDTEDWIAKEVSATNIAFGPPASASGGYVWGINIKDASSTTLEKEIAAQGNQWSDRKESKKDIKVNSTDATLVTVTTASKPTWISKVVYVVKNSKIYEISNGAVDKNEFDTFYNSLKFTAATTTTTSTDLTYTNPTYGFTMTFPAAWKGYKFKEANLEGITKTYYVEIPTTDSSATGDSTADKGYYSPFAIGVYTLDQWATVEASEGPKDTLITKNTKYAFGWSQANGVPPTDFTAAMAAEIKTIIASFKLK